MATSKLPIAKQMTPLQKAELLALLKAASGTKQWAGWTKGLVEAYRAHCLWEDAEAAKKEARKSYWTVPVRKPWRYQWP